MASWTHCGRSSTTKGFASPSSVRALIVVTHEFGFAREAADRVAFLEHGRILEVGPARAVLESPQDERARAFFERVL